MNCPVCTNPLTQKIVSDITLDVCHNGCGGIWFDQFEFKKLDEKKEPDAETLLHLNIVASAKPLSNEPYNCPKCLNVKMLRHAASAKRKVVMDECGKCAGVWLDAGELSEIRNEYDSEAERTQAAEAVFAEMFTNKLAREMDTFSAPYKKLKALSWAFRFISPSFYFKKK